MADLTCDGSGEIQVISLIDGINSRLDLEGGDMAGHITLIPGASGSQAIRADEAIVSRPADIGVGSRVSDVIKVTRAEFDALPAPSADTMFLIVG